MKLKNLSRQWIKESLKASGLVVAFATCLLSVYAVVLFHCFEEKLRVAHTNELKKVTLSVHKQIRSIDSVFQYLIWRLAHLSRADPVLFQEAIARNPGKLLQLIWIPLSGDPVTGASSQGSAPNLMQFFSRQSFVPRNTLSKIKNWVLFHKTIKPTERGGLAGQLIIAMPLNELIASSFFTTIDIAPQRTSRNHLEYVVPLQGEKNVLILKTNTLNSFALYWKEHRLSLFIFLVFSFGVAIFFIIYGRQSYQKALIFLKETIDSTNQKNLDLTHLLSLEQKKMGLSTQKLTLLAQASKQLESLICDVLMRQRLMREKAYLYMAAFLEEEYFEDDESVKLWVQDMQNHFGLPHIDIFSFKSAFEQVLAIFVVEMAHNKIKLHVDDKIDSDLIESDRLILSVILANLLHRCVTRLPKEGILQVTLTRKKTGFKIQILDNGYVVTGIDFFSKMPRHKFFFLEPDVLKSLCTSLRIKITIKDRTQEGQEHMNSTLFEVPLKIKRGGSEMLDETKLPTNVIRFPQKKGKRLERGDPA